jgi:hypothetical protein
MRKKILTQAPDTVAPGTRNCPMAGLREEILGFGKLGKKIQEIGPCIFEDCIKSGPLYTKESKVELFTLGIGKTYAGYRITFASFKVGAPKKFQRLEDKPPEDMLDWDVRFMEPTPGDIKRFKKDIAEAAKSDPNIAAFVAANPELKLK